ncbi:MAG: twin-arginine translocase subunit TatC [Alicyclobacillaceae bacterium]|nr:twin-arginine translocase subunit TatC [Alicyclobacillaceae bacterium]
MEPTWTLVEHLSDLRKRIIFSLIVLVATFIAALVFVHQIFGILEYPLKGVRLAVLGPGDVIQIYFSVAGMVALGLSLPFLLFQLWMFIKPALTARESHYALSLLPFATFMFVFGVLFSYFLIFPILLHFLLSLANESFIVLLTAQKYFKFLITLTLPFGLIFEMPILLLFLTQIGVITPKRLVGMRKYAYLCIVVFASFISPPELVSHLSVAVPMMALYEISILLCRVQMARKRRRGEQYDKSEDTSSGGLTSGA